MKETIRVGFTGTREGMTGGQYEAVRELARILHADFFHHGDCVGADADAYTLFSWQQRKMTGEGRTIAHPCNLHELRAFTRSDEVRKVKPPLERNKDIVDETDILIVCPKEYEEQRRSGTWATFRYAKKRRAEGKKQTIYLVLPNGQIENI